MRISALAVLAPLAIASASCSGSGSDSGEEGVETAPAEVAGTPVADASAADIRPPAFAMCASCHQVAPGKNGVGPSLAGVFGANAGHVETYNYSAAMKQSGLKWDEATLDTYLTAPAQAVPGTKMTFAGLKDPAARKQVIEYLKGI